MLQAPQLEPPQTPWAQARGLYFIQVLFGVKHARSPRGGSPDARLPESYPKIAQFSNSCCAFSSCLQNRFYAVIAQSSFPWGQNLGMWPLGFTVEPQKLVLPLPSACHLQWTPVLMDHVSLL